jgi:hypothetical protein
MKRGAFLLLIPLLITAASCSGRKDKLDRHGLIPEKEMVSILTEVHLADGLLSVPKVTEWFASLDSTTTYRKIIEKHGYSKESMDKTMRYYFVNNPKKLIAIYDRVLGTLSEMELLVRGVDGTHIKSVSDLWKGKDYYSFPELSGTNSTRFDVTLKYATIYSLSFTATFFPDDQSVNPQASIYSCNADSVETGKRNYIKTLNYIKDGYPHKYVISLYTPSNSPLHFRGWLYDSENDFDKCERHAIIENISISFSSILK